MAINWNAQQPLRTNGIPWRKIKNKNEVKGCIALLIKALGDLKNKEVARLFKKKKRKKKKEVRIPFHHFSFPL
jgi:hypothetical protein